MKISYCLLYSFAILSLLPSKTYAQTDSRDMEAYSRQNIAFTNAQILGINRKEYAQCIQSVNYHDPSVTHKYVTINGIRFSDDGKNNDLVGGDGILTSEKSLPYQTYNTPLDPGQYRQVTTPIRLTDKAFTHNPIQSNGLQGDGISISCTFKWKKCTSWPQHLISLCETFSWPFTGGFEILECKVIFTLD